MVELNKVYGDLLSNRITSEEASKIIKSHEIQKVINSLINKNSINKLVPFTEEDLQFVYMIINITQFIYNNSGEDTGISDGTYDTLYALMLANGGQDIVSSPIAPSYIGVEYHKYPSLRGTLKKIFYLTLEERRTNPSRKYLDEWKSSMESKYFTITGNHINLDDEEIYVFPKWDGVSGIFEFDESNELVRVLTRGFTETNEAQNITHIFKDWFKRNYQELKGKSYGLKTEVMMKYKDLDYYNEKYHTNYKNTRSIVSAILNSDEYDEEKASLLHVIPLRIGYENGQQELATEAISEYPSIRCKLKNRDVIRNFALEHANVDGLRCDGAVIYFINPKLQEILGRENSINNFEVAYKFTEESCYSKIIDVEFNIGLFGRIAPVAVIKPVKLKGNTIDHISLGSIGRFKNLELRKGDRVKVLYDIIPYLVFDSTCKHGNGKVFRIPVSCPECGSLLLETDSKDILFCNNKNCPCRVKGKILNYLDKMNIDNISYGTIDKLYEAGIVTSILDLYKLEKNAKNILDIEGFGTTKLQLWIDGINAKRESYDYMVLGALGIEGISKKTFAKILETYSINELIDIVTNNNIHALTQLQGIQIKNAIKIINGLSSNLELIKSLEKELIILESKGTNKESKYSVCFTKIRDNDLEKIILATGGTIVDSVTKDTTFLVVPTKDVKSSKVNKALKYGIKIIPIDDFEATLSNFLK